GFEAEKADGKQYVIVNGEEWGPYEDVAVAGFASDGSFVFYTATRTKPSYYRVDRVKASISFEKPIRRIAVLRFDAVGKVPESNERVVEDKLIAALVGQGGLRVLERSQIEKVLEEQEFSWFGTVDQKTAVNLGKLLGVEYVVFGSLTGEPNRFSINARLVSVETGEVIMATESSSDGTDAGIRKACTSIATQITGSIGQ
ncbi:MAG: CsgG/HfaB family protein, partial [candidate division WOR-3 bacterium]